jgi:hypothetical protein
MDKMWSKLRGIVSKNCPNFVESMISLWEAFQLSYMARPLFASSSNEPELDLDALQQNHF